MTDSNRERRVRRMARRQGLCLRKARVRNPSALDYGTYAIVDPYGNLPVWSVPPSFYGLTLEDVEDWFADDAERTASG